MPAGLEAATGAIVKGGIVMMKWRKESALDLYNLIAAIFLLVSPWLFVRANETAAIDLRTTGAAIAILSLAAMVAFSIWEEWANLLLGCWLIVSPWLLGFAHTRAMHFSIVAGAVVVFMATIELWLVYEAKHFGSPSSQTSERR
jgi:SPW repeat-containing protein